jgi:hypothetical protein
MVSGGWMSRGKNTINTQTIKGVIKMQDFPAAHSMDTEWFAIDADGNIGIFASGEGGAVPQTHYSPVVESQEQDPVYLNNIFYEWSKRTEDGIIAHSSSSQQILQSLGIDLSELENTSKGNIGSIFLRSFMNTSIDENEKSIKSWQYSDTHWLLFPNGDELSMLKILKNDKWRLGDYVIRFSGQPQMLFVSYSPISTIQMLLKKGYLNYYLRLNSNSYDNTLLTLLGCFSYSHDHSSPTPYEWEGNQPTSPLKLSDLPERLQDALSWNWFENIKFADSQKIQPIEHTKCRTWKNDKWWLDTQNNHHEKHPHE